MAGGLPVFIAPVLPACSYFCRQSAGITGAAPALVGAGGCVRKRLVSRNHGNGGESYMYRITWISIHGRSEAQFDTPQNLT